MVIFPFTTILIFLTAFLLIWVQFRPVHVLHSQLSGIIYSGEKIAHWLILLLQVLFLLTCVWFYIVFMDVIDYDIRHSEIAVIGIVPVILTTILFNILNHWEGLRNNTLNRALLLTTIIIGNFLPLFSLAGSLVEL